jgi:hypothetical protein
MTESLTDDRALPSHATWAIKNFATADRMVAIKAAQRAKQPMAEWLGAAIRLAVVAEREPPKGDIMPPIPFRRIDHVPPTIEEFAQAIDLAERLAKMRGARLTSRTINAMIRKLAEMVGIDENLMIPTRRLGGKEDYGRANDAVRHHLEGLGPLSEDRAES